MDCDGSGGLIICVTRVCDRVTLVVGICDTVFLEQIRKASCTEAETERRSDEEAGE